MNILDVTLFYPPQIGGAVTTTTEIVNALRKSNHKVIILAPKEDNIFTGVEKIDNKIKMSEMELVYRVHLPKKKGKWLMIIKYSLFSMFKLKNEEFNIIIGHFHFNTGAGWTTYLISKIFKVPFILRVHDVYEPKSLKEKILFKINSIPLKKASKVLSINHPSKLYLERNKFNKSENILVIPNGASKINKKGFINNKRQNICFIGTLSENRALERIFSLVKIFEVKKLDINIHIIGGGPEYEKLKNKIESNILYKNKIILHGTYTRERAMQELSKMDISIGLLKRNRTNDYQLLIKLIESIQLGIPWVSVTTKGIKQFNLETNTGIEVETLEEFADAIEVLITNDSTYKDKVDNCTKNSINFDWDQISLDLNYIFTNTLKGKN